MQNIAHSGWIRCTKMRNGAPITRILILPLTFKIVFLTFASRYIRWDGCFTTHGMWLICFHGSTNPRLPVTSNHVSLLCQQTESRMMDIHAYQSLMNLAITRRVVLLFFVFNTINSDRRYWPTKPYISDYARICKQEEYTKSHNSVIIWIGSDARNAILIRNHAKRFCLR